MKRWMLALLVSCLTAGPLSAKGHRGGDSDDASSEEGARPGKKHGKGEHAEKRKAPKEVQEFRKGMREKRQEFQKGMKEKRRELAKELEGLDGEKCRAVRKEKMQALKKEREAHRAEMESEKAAFVKANPEAGRFFEKGRKGKGGKGEKAKRMKKGAKKAMAKLRCKGDKPPKKGMKGKKGKKGMKADEADDDSDEAEEMEDDDDSEE